MDDVQADAKAIFLEALDCKGADELMRFLEQACGSDAALRTRVEELLRAHRDAGAFLGGAEKQGATCDQPSAERPGTVIGPYKLLQQIGEGGMGTVYMAEQTQPVQRKVALKVIKPGMDSRQVVARFEAERQALAMMDHVNIARVFDGGATENGRPYFVMELVHGVPITRYCDDNHLTPRERLELFVPVCQAIQHAHQKGVIHRDVKPSNVMVTLYDGKPVPKVIDFGVAKATEQKLTERTLFTQYGTMVGTLEYMSPEQAEMSALGVDTRSDIYSLGVLLYELLTGSTPLDHKRMKEAAYAEILRMIKEEEPPRPSTRLSDSGEALASISAQRHMEPAKLTKLVKGELDWIVMKSLEKDRNRRYETANGFAADVQRYLNDEQVLACPPSAGYRFRKFARRNKAAVLTAAAILFVLVAGIAGTTFGLIRAERARAEEAEQRQIADAQKKKAEQAEADTLADYRASTDDAIEQLIGSKPDLGPQEKAYLEKTLKRWQAFAARQGDDERSQAIRAEGHHRVALLWAKLGRRDAARTECETARDLYKKLAAAFPDLPGYQHELARTHINLGNLLNTLGQRDAGRKELETARDLQTKLVAAFHAVPDYQQKLALSHISLGNLLMDLGHRDAARTEFETARDLQKKLADAFPSVPAYQQELATTHNNLGRLLSDLGQRDAARTEFETARDLQKKLADAFPAVPAYQQELARSHISLGILLDGLGQRDAARTEFETARDLQKKLVAAFPAVPRYQQYLAYTHNNLGATLAGLRQHDAARTEFETARDLRKRLADTFPAVPGYQQELAETHNNLGAVLTEQGKGAAARTEYETARDLQKKLAAAFPAVPAYQQVLARTHNNLGILLNNGLGQGDAARTEYQTARDLYKKLADAFPAVPEYQVDLGGSYYNLGNLVRDEGRPTDSLHWYNLAIRTLTPVYDKDPRAVRAKQFLRNSHFGRATAYGQLKKHAEAVKDWNKVIELDPKNAQTHSNIGFTLQKQGKPDEAIVWCRKAIAIDPKHANGYNVLGLALDDQEKRDDAIAAFRKAIDLDPKHAHAYSNLGNDLARQGKFDQAITYCRKAIAINPKNTATYITLGIALRRQKKLDEAIACYHKVLEIDPKCPKAHTNLGNALRDQGKLDEAIACYRKAVEIDPNDADGHIALGIALRTQSKSGEAIAAFKQAVEIAPKNAAAHYSLAWELTVCSDLKLRDPRQALVSARLAAQLDPKSIMYWQGLGYAEYRSGNWKAAVEAFQTVKELGSAGDSLEWFPLSMAYWQLGNKDVARKTYDQAVQWMEKHNPKDGFLLGLQAEAAKLMGIALKKE